MNARTRPDMPDGSFFDEIRKNYQFFEIYHITKNVRIKWNV